MVRVCLVLYETTGLSSTAALPSYVPTFSVRESLLLCILASIWYHQCFGFELSYILIGMWGLPGGSVVKNPPAKQDTWLWSLVQEDCLENEKATTPVFLPGKSHGQRSLAGYSPWGHKELDMTEQLNNNNRYVMISPDYSNLHFPITGNVEHLPICLFTICISLWWGVRWRFWPIS